MDKGIRPACNAKFLELLPTRENTTKGNTAFRKNVMASIMEDYGITLASAATHYNHAFLEAKKDPNNAVLLQGLGRPEDKKGGRKPKAKAEAAVLTGAELLLSNVLAARQGNEGETAQAVEAPADEAPAATLLLETKLYSVKKVADGTVVAENLTQAEAEALVQKAQAAKKSKLQVV